MEPAGAEAYTLFAQSMDRSGYAREEGEDNNEARFVAGVRIWF